MIKLNGLLYIIPNNQGSSHCSNASIRNEGWRYPTSIKVFLKKIGTKDLWIFCTKAVVGGANVHRVLI